MNIKLILAFATFAIVTFATDASGQAFPMWRKEMSPAEVAEAIEDADDTRLLATPVQILSAIRQAVPETEVEDIPGLIAYLRSLEVRPCPRGEHQLSRILGGKLDWDFRRPFGNGEPCFFDRNLNKFILSGRCGNVIMHATTAIEPTSAMPVYVSQTYVFLTDTTARAAEPPPPPPQIIVKNGWGWKEIGIGAGILATAGAIYYFATRDNNGAEKPPPTPEGGPVNPPNRSGVLLRIPIGGW